MKLRHGLQVSFLAAMVGPRVAAAAAARALEVLAEEDPAIAAEAAALESDGQQQQDGHSDQDQSAAPGLILYLVAGKQSMQLTVLYQKNKPTLQCFEQAPLACTMHAASKHHS